MKRMFSILILAPLAGCAGMSRAMEYNDVSSVQQPMPDDTYKIFDKPGEGRMMVSPSLAKASAMGAVSGATLGIAQVQNNLPGMEAAALAYFKSTGRSCTITSRDEVIRPQWEFKYTC